MAGVPGVAALRRELYNIRGHYADMGQSLEALGRIRDLVDDLDEKLTTLERSSQSQKPKPTTRVKEGQAIDFDVQNGYGVRVDTLTLDRFRSGHVEGTRIFTEQVAADLREKGKRFCDPEPPSLELPVPVEPPYMYPKDVQELMLKRMEVERERDEQRKEELDADVYGRIQLWRRLPKVLKKGVMFGKGNDLLLLRPQGMRSPGGAVQTFTKFERGLLKDGWFLTALALISQNRRTLERLFVSAEHRKVGMYTFQFYCTGDELGEGEGWTCVTVDDLMPCARARRNGDGRVEYVLPFLPPGGLKTVGTDSVLPIFGLTDDVNEQWVSLVEKAYAKFLGSYSLLHRGDTASAISHLTGGTCSLLQWDPAALDDDGLAVLWWLVTESARIGLLMSCTMAAVDQNLAKGDNCLVDRSASSFMEWEAGDLVLLTTEISPSQLYEMHARNRARAGLEDDDKWMKFHKEGAKLIKIGDLLGADEWEGEWSHTSPLWTPTARETVGYGAMDEHIAWMKVADFAKQYNTLLTCCNFADGPLAWVEAFAPCNPRLVRNYHQQYLITVAPRPDSVVPETPHNAETVHSTHSRAVSEKEDSGDEADEALPVLIYCSQPNKEDFTTARSHNYTDGMDKAEELDVRLFSVADGRHILPEEVRGERRTTLMRGDDGVWTEEAEPEPPLQWPTEGQEDLRYVETGTEFVVARRVSLTPGQYVLTVGKDEQDAKELVRCIVAVFSEEDLDGRTSSPFNLGAQRSHSRSGSPSPSPGVWGRNTPGTSRSPRRRKPTGFVLSGNPIGSASDPLSIDPKQRPETPFDRVQERIKAAQARPGSAWSTRPGETPRPGSAWSTH